MHQYTPEEELSFHKTLLLLGNLLRVVLDEVTAGEAVQGQTRVFVNVDNVQELWEGSWRWQTDDKSIIYSLIDLLKA